MSPDTAPSTRRARRPCHRTVIRQSDDLVLPVSGLPNFMNRIDVFGTCGRARTESTSPSLAAATAWAAVVGLGFASDPGHLGPSQELWRWVLLSLVIAPWAEEVLFRAGLQRELRRRWGWSARSALGMTAITFGFAHLLIAAAVAPEPSPALLVAAATTLPALAIGWVYERGGRLLPCIALHAALNLALMQTMILWHASGAAS